MKKQTILITGASSGIGRATVELFSQKGWQVAATMRTPEKSADLAKLNGVKLYALDVNDEGSIQRAMSAAIKDFGKIEVVLNNAGFAAVGVFEASTKEQVQQQFDTNVFGVMNVTRGILPHFRANKGGKVLTVSSVGGRVTFPIYSLYHSTKWAVEGFVESLHYELRPFGIQMKLIEPGPIKTDFYSRSQDLHKKPELKDYDHYMDVAYKNSNDAGANAQGPEVVAQKIYQAANDNSSRMRYPVGGNAPVLVAIKQLLPHWVFVGMVRNVVEKGFKG